MPMMGSFTASYTCHTIRTATGNTAGPDRPPVRLAMSGPFRFQVDPHPQQGVDEADAVGSRVGCRPWRSPRCP